jgi:hypothetical protein
MNTSALTIDSETESDSDSSGLIDLSQLPLHDLWSLDSSSALDHSLARAVDAAGRQEKEAVSAFNSAI